VLESSDTHQTPSVIENGFLVLCCVVLFLFIVVVSFAMLAARLLPVMCFGTRTETPTNAIVFRVSTCSDLAYCCWLDFGGVFAVLLARGLLLSESCSVCHYPQKQLESPRLTLCVRFSGFLRMEGASRVTRPCFDLHFDRFDGLMFKAAKPLENVCTTTGLPGS